MSTQTTAMSEADARTLIAPWYSMFTQPVHDDIAALHRQVVTEDYRSFAGDGPGESWGRDISIKVIEGFAKSIPDMRFELREVLVAGDRVIVRGEVTGTPAEALFGGLIPHTGKNFRIMAIDIQSIRDGKICKTYHMENWFAALRQLRAE